MDFCKIALKQSRSALGVRHVLMLVAASAVLTVPLRASAESFEQSWLGSIGTFCEGFGIAGAFRAYVSGVAEKQDDGSWVVTSLAAHASSAAFAQNEGSANAFAVVKLADQPKSKVVLTRPMSPVVEAALKPDETRRVYLPNGTKLVVLKGGELRVSVSAAAKTNQGACALGSTEEVIKLP